MKSKKRIVVRQYTSKKTGQKKFYTYVYSKYTVQGKSKHRQSRTIMKDGKLTKYGEKYVELYKDNLPSFSQKNDFQAKVLSWQRNGKTLTEEFVTSSFTRDTTARFIYNMGGDVDDLSEDLGIAKASLLSEANWNFEKQVFRNVDKFGNVSYYQFDFDYDSHSITYSQIGNKQGEELFYGS